MGPNLGRAGSITAVALSADDMTNRHDVEATIRLDAESATHGTVAVIIPCHDEATTIGGVIASLRSEIPFASIYVTDNGSTDGTAAIARDHGAKVITEARRGKGYAVRRLFADVEADYFVLVDGDGTYDPKAAPVLIDELIERGADMVVGKREAEPGAHRLGHEFGNRMLSWTFRTLFGLHLDDTLSGYRVFTRRFVKTFPSLTAGFEVEADMNAHAAAMGLPYAEISVRYSERPEGSVSKLSTVRDGWRILRRLLRLFRDWRPLLTFSVAGLVTILAATAALMPVLIDFAETGLVARQPTLIVAGAAIAFGFGLVATGMILDRITRLRLEMARLLYLASTSPNALSDSPPK
ncbi:MAG: glycosyltransferase [Candidatus Microthrix parvicella]|mgnify:FL=1|uniref:Putative glycosyltransferase n=1 Tax=Candidatus Neomicrothrix parvicella RN1 TaxID=1229780 RepID=R4Z4S9_9ACTN|nr:putative glycosyltransferase [Candidatus Microthrix parvicella RN1]